LSDKKLDSQEQKLKAELTTTRKKIEEILGKIVNAEPEDILKLAVEKGKLEDLEKSLLAALAAIDYAKVAHRREAEATAALAERHRKETLFAYLKENPPPCPSCESTNTKLVTKPQQPEGPSANFWTIPNVKWRVAFTCSDRAHQPGTYRFTVRPDEEYELDVDSKVTAQPPKKEGRRKRRRST
jgi:Zn finger protein HypA/HybF involved in hydrogenase expression